MILVVLSLFTSHISPLKADNRPYLCELGLQAGCGYYVGDAAPHIFMHPREAYGVHFRYKFTKRWALQAKVAGQRITGHDYTMQGEQLETMWTNSVYSADVMAEFNFFRFGAANKYDKRIRPYTPYIFLGIGVGYYESVAPYIPLGVGFKWKFSEHCGLNVAWQHNIYMSDNLENRETLDNKYNMNGSNWMNCDLTGQLTVGLVVEFGKAARECRMCNY